MIRVIHKTVCWSYNVQLVAYLDFKIGDTKYCFGIWKEQVI